MIGALMAATAAAGKSSPLELSFRAAYSDAANASTYTFTATDIGAPSSSREVFVPIAIFHGGVATRTITGVTIGGIAATLEAQINNSTLQGFLIARAVVPTGTTADIVVTLNANAGSCAIAVYRVVNRTSTSAGVSDVSSGTFSGASTSLTGIDTAVNSMVFSIVMWGNTTSAQSISGLGAVVDASVTPESTGYASFGSTQPQTSASSNATLTWSWTTSRNGLAAAWVFPG